MTRNARYEQMSLLARRIHELLVKHYKTSGSQNEATCALRMAEALWGESPTFSATDRLIGARRRSVS
jgi:hypothetical protein